MSTESAPTTTQLPLANADVNLEHETQGASTNSPVSPAPAPAPTSDSDARTSPFIVMLKVGVDLDAFLAETGIVPYMKTPMQAPGDNIPMWFAGQCFPPS
ncbi:hypothetical protein H0H92_011795 [Tricholoma furcatifolium]|nr:hypothetical protein H0H92_011795 [Tricholoma furcatifolium]